MRRTTTLLRALIRRKKFITMPSAYDALTARLIESVGFDAVSNGGFVAGGSTCISEPLITMTEQIEIARRMASAIGIPLIMDAGAGWGEPLHTMRTVRESINAGIAGIHIEDQLYPKRAHYHAHVVHNVSLKDYREKIRFACQQRDELDKDFVIIARSDACNVQGYKEAIKRINVAAEQGADMAMIFPRDHKETVNAPKDATLPMVYVLGRGFPRQGRPLYTYRQLEDIGYAAVSEATLSIYNNFHFTKKWLEELKRTGDYTGMNEEEFVAARLGVLDTVGLNKFYRIERATVEKSSRRKVKR